MVFLEIIQGTKKIGGSAAFFSAYEPALLRDSLVTWMMREKRMEEMRGRLFP